MDRSDFPTEMPVVDFHSLPAWVNLLVIGAAGSTVWLAGSRLAQLSDVIADRMDLKRAFVGILLLATATSLPEIATTVTASAAGNAALAVSNLFGGVALQTMVLAIADLVVLGNALSFAAPRPILVLQGVLLLLLLSLALAGAVVNEIASLFGIGLWPALLLLGYLASVWQTYRHQGEPRWRAVDVPDDVDVEAEASSQGSDCERMSNRQLYAAFVLASLLVLAGGFVIAQSADAVSVQTGVTGTVMGATLVALTTSLPELSTTVSAIRLGAPALAMGNIFGSNAILLALFFLADAAYRDGPIFDAIERSSVFLGALGMIVTCIYLWGLLERHDRTMFRMGYDSIAVTLVYLGGIAVLVLAF